MSWYEEWFWSDAYTRVYDHRDEEEAEQLVDLIEHEMSPAPNAHLLDIGCGRGRHTRTLARRGYRVTGIDLSEKAIEAARAEAADEGLDATTSFHVGDMREPVGTDVVDGVVNGVSSASLFSGRRVRRLQSGVVTNYAALLTLGLVAGLVILTDRGEPRLCDCPAME